MKLNLYLNPDTFTHFSNTLNETLIKCLLGLDEVVELTKDLKEIIWVDTSLYYVEIFSGESLMDWLYTDNYSDGMHEERKMLLKLINYGQTPEAQDFKSVMTCIEAESPISNTAFLCLFEVKRSPLYIREVEGHRDAHRFYLTKSSSIEMFLDDVEICFPNLSFHSNISRTMKSLKEEIEIYAGEITRHLGALNDYAPTLYRTHRTKGEQEVLRILKSTTGVECSPEGDAQSARDRLTFKFSSDAGIDEDFICSPHTKISKVGNTGDTSYGYDRIYFNCGREDFCAGKILIAHIGQHL